MFELVHQSYENKWYTAEDVAAFVIAGFITKNEYRQIVGTDYDTVADPQPA